MKYQYRIWIHGLFASMISAGANGITVIIVDPGDFNPFVDGSWVKLGSVVLVSALVSGAAYLKAHPLPDPEKDTDYKQVVKESIDEMKGTGPGN